MDDIEAKLKDIQQNLISKVDCEFFDDEVHLIKGLLSTFQEHPGTSKDEKPNLAAFASMPTMNSKDANKIRDLTNKFKETDTILQKLLK